MVSLAVAIGGIGSTLLPWIIHVSGRALDGSSGRACAKTALSTQRNRETA
jgi:hypothetical protein